MKHISPMTFIIDTPLSLTLCSDRDRQSVVVKWREVKTNCSAIVRSHGKEFLI